ncbi:unnamed protein product [marine sediment metagenome]|uniref:Uncharacterized protein n=1 Tax=marine sediment metagenome TaxID=412755 RepID=X1I366_9ZZZZ
MKIEISNRLAIELLNIMALNGNVMSDECREFKEKLEKMK